MEPVSLKLWGEPNNKLSKFPRDVRWGTHGLRHANWETGTYFDHEKQVGGGVLRLIADETGCTSSAEQIDWLRSEKFLDDVKSNGSGARQLGSGAGAAPRPAHGLIVAASREAREICAYDYSDENGDLLYQVQRFEPKTFRQRRPGPTPGNWIPNLDGVRRVAYRLPEIIKAVAERLTIFVSEGEKDADSLWALGLAATTNSGGAGKWQREFSEYLCGADVVILPHNDDAGRAHGASVATSLGGVAARI